MKKTIRINISGIIFNIDEDAYEKLQQYLNSITKQFINTEEGNEIIADVENRIAELFQDKIGDRKEVVNLHDIEYVIEIMGKPEDFEESPEDEEPVYTDSSAKRNNRRIYRNPDDRVLSGVSSGLAAYFGIEPIIIRVIFVLMTLFYGTSILIYILLWVIIPEAKTRGQKLEMRGQDINLSNIESSIKKEFSQVKSNFQNWQKSKNYDRLRSNAGEALNLFWKFFLILLRFVFILFTILFLIAGIALLGGMTGLYFFDNTILSPLSWNNVSFSLYEFASFFTDNFNARVLIVTSYLIILIPVLSIIYLGLKYIFRFKAKNRYIGLYAGALWLVSFIVLIVSSVKIGYGMRAEEEISQSYAIDNKGADTLYIDLFNGDNYTEWWNDHKMNFNKVYLEFEENGAKLFGQPSFTIQKSATNEMALSIVKLSNGINRQEAIKNAKNIQYEWQQDDSILYFHRHFQINGDKKIRNQKTEILLKIPVGKVVYIGKNMDQICSYIENLKEYGCDEMTGHYWQMTDEGLRLLGETGFKNQDEQKQFQEEITNDTINTGIKKEIDDMKAELDSM